MSTSKTQKARAYAIKATESKKEYVSPTYLRKSIERAYKAGYNTAQRLAKEKELSEYSGTL